MAKALVPSIPSSEKPATRAPEFDSRSTQHPLAVSERLGYQRDDIPNKYAMNAIECQFWPGCVEKKLGNQ